MLKDYSVTITRLYKIGREESTRGKESGAGLGFLWGHQQKRGKLRTPLGEAEPLSSRAKHFLSPVLLQTKRDFGETISAHDQKAINNSWIRRKEEKL